MEFQSSLITPLYRIEIVASKMPNTAIAIVAHQWDRENELHLGKSKETINFRNILASAGSNKITNSRIYREVGDRLNREIKMARDPEISINFN